MMGTCTETCDYRQKHSNHCDSKDLDIVSMEFQNMKTELKNEFLLNINKDNFRSMFVFHYSVIYSYSID